MAELRSLELMMLLIIASSQVYGYVLKDDTMRQVTGRLLVLEPHTGNHQRLTRRHVEAGDETPRAIRLELGSEGINLDMTLTRRSVWTRESRAYERREDEIVEVPLALDPSCFMAGDLNSGEGAASFSYCDGVSGIVQTPEMEYLVEQAPGASSSEDFSEVTVSLVEPTLDPHEDDDALVAMEEEERIYFASVEGSEDSEWGSDDPGEDSSNDSNNSTGGRWKRCEDNQSNNQRNSNQQNSNQNNQQNNGADITGEIAVYADKNYADFLRSSGRNNLAKATTWFANKWNVIAKVYGDKSKVGVKFVLQLKHVEVWWNNPGHYRSVQNDQNLNKHLNNFCDNTRSSQADHRMLYTAGVGGGTMGLAWVGGICNRNRACSIVKNKSASNLKVELHEFGHNLGFQHEPQLQPCSKPDGFMGWTRTHKFNDCYRRELLKTYKKGQRSRDCLRQTNMNKRVLNG